MDEGRSAMRDVSEGLEALVPYFLPYITISIAGIPLFLIMLYPHMKHSEFVNASGQISQ